MMKSINRIGSAIRECGIAVEGPALLLEARNGIGNGDCAFELLQRTVDQRAMGPGTTVGNMEMIPPGLCLETRGAVRRDAVAERAVGAAEFAGTADFLGKLFVAPHAFDQNAHVNSPAIAVTRRSSLRRRFETGHFVSHDT